MFNNFPFNHLKKYVVHTFASSYYRRAIKMFDFKNIKNVLFLMKVKKVKKELVEKEDLTLL